MPGKKDAEYWRNYRAQRAARTDEAVRKNADLDVEIAGIPQTSAAELLRVAAIRIRELEEEVRQLKRQLSQQAMPVFTDAVSKTRIEPQVAVMHQFGQSKPAPKPGKK